MSIGIARVGDMGEGICCIPYDDDPHPDTGSILAGAGLSNADSMGIARVGDILLSDSHSAVGIIIEGSPTVFCEGMSVARIGDHFDGCFFGEIIEGSSTVFAGG